MNAGALGNAIGPLTAMEYDGYVVFQSKDHKLTMPWHILPRKSAAVEAMFTKLPAVDPVTRQNVVPLKNRGVGDAQVYAYSLLGTGPDTPRGDRGEQQPNPTIRAIGVNTIPVPAGVCGASANFVWEFVFNMYERKATPVGTVHQVEIDVNGDGVLEALVRNHDFNGVTAVSDGRQITAAFNLTTGAGVLRFPVEHATNSTNVILRACGSDLGFTAANFGTPMTANFYAYNWYFGGDVESHLGPFRIAPLGEEFTAAIPGDLLTYNQRGDLTFRQWDLYPNTDAQAGIMLVTNSQFSNASNGGATRATETVLLTK
jgi:hypothetical protein